MLRRRSRRRSDNRKNISLLFVCTAIVLGSVIGLSSNLVQSDTHTKYNPQFIENYGSMSKKSDVSVEVANKRHNSGNETTTSGNEVDESGNNSSTGTGSGSNTGSQNSSSNYGDNSTRDTDATPSVLVSDNPNNTFPQTGEATNSLSLIGIMILSTMFSLIGIKLIDKIINTNIYSKL